jgi:hypothetical protein
MARYPQPAAFVGNVSARRGEGRLCGEELLVLSGFEASGDGCAFADKQELI